MLFLNIKDKKIKATTTAAVKPSLKILPSVMVIPV